MTHFLISNSRRDEFDFNVTNTKPSAQIVMTLYTKIMACRSTIFRGKNMLKMLDDRVFFGITIRYFVIFYYNSIFSYSDLNWL